jgi:tetratricopeptide (TPR) repeat protein
MGESREDGQTGQALLRIGLERVAAADPAGAIDAFGQAVERAPNDAEIRLQFGLALEAVGELDDAAYQLLQGEKRAPDDARIHRALGTVFYKKGLYDKAVRFLGRATKLDPHDARAFFSLGVVHDARHDPGAAIAALREAVRIDPHFIDARRTLIDALAAIGEHAQAIDAIDELLHVAPRDEQAAQNREVLAEALAQMATHRLLGKHEEDLEKSALVHEGQMKRKGRLPDGVVRYSAKLADLLVSYAAGGPPDAPIESLMLVLPDPQRASKARDAVYGVTVVGKDGRRAPADFATAVTLTFLRESIGLPLTQAGVFYSRLIAGEPRIDFGGASIKFASRPSDRGDEIHGLVCALLPKVTFG